MRVPMHVRKAAKAKLKRTEPKAANFDWADRLVEAWTRISGARAGQRLVALFGEQFFREHRFDASMRRIDIAFPRLKIAIECQGGENVAHFSHRSKEGTLRDAYKANALGLQGWLVIYFTGQDCRRRPMWCMEQVQQAIERRMIEGVPK